MAKGATKDKTGVSAEEMMRLLDCSQPVLSGYVKKGLVIRAGRGRYDDKKSIPKIIKHYREQAAGRLGRNDGIDIVKEGALLKAASRRLADIRAARLAGDLISVSAVEEAWGDLADLTKQVVLSFPSRARALVQKLNGKDQKVLERMVRDALTEVAFADKKPLIPKERNLKLDGDEHAS